MGFSAPTKIQELSIPILLADPPQNMIAQAQSGTRKTATYLLAAMSRVDCTKEYPKVKKLLSGEQLHHEVCSTANKSVALQLQS
jgi:superfamily II DNA/RNA helicase